MCLVVNHALCTYLPNKRFRGMHTGGKLPYRTIAATKVLHQYKTQLEQGANDTMFVYTSSLRHWFLNFFSPNTYFLMCYACHWSLFFVSKYMMQLGLEGLQAVFSPLWAKLQQEHALEGVFSHKAHQSRCLAELGLCYVTHEILVVTQFENWFIVYGCLLKRWNQQYVCFHIH